jgi:hypothetical protein
MDIQQTILIYYRELLLIAGVLLLFLGLAPVVSEKYYQKHLVTKWDEKIWPFSKDSGYLYGRYIRQINIILMGATLVGIAIYKSLFP